MRLPGFSYSPTTLGDDVIPVTTPNPPRCAVCAQPSLPARGRRFGGRRVCTECWQGLTCLERSSAFRRLPRTSLLAHFTAEVAVRLPGRPTA
jgi:hypothetical protein